MKFKNGQTIFYQSLTDDVIKSHQQDYQLPKSYKWQKNSVYICIQQVFQWLISGFAYFYCHWWLHIRYVNGNLLKQLHSGAYLYANHTQPQGDVFSPFCVIHHPAVIVSPANLGIPIIGRLIPLGGGLPIPNNIRDMHRFTEAVYQQVDQNHTVVIYPEAHVWPFATRIRPFNETSFHYPSYHPAPVYTMTTTYQASKWHQKPNITVYLDGPFFVDTSLPAKQRQKDLHDKVMLQFEKRSQNSSYAYLNYERRL
ncbi:1-acyl-sn-glycerol-3-phosphate acyltransferase [Secundilactobacillus folii]|uniref:1-acyl-sn-glycerol-3-phosphate acyltransferase n=1 Tax=Secundilactobacillus folii TaxID=2678357 RepID=A0A7X2XVX1_9LACO|nr:1-acyl-sn-glycerol-3-phosphate acyltransferase [Secundilactobacillus folii]MTV82593.1 1-acyl-sn-glycerol-3-phosphate acyltransferase [Secundilactobacillus folii]